MLLHRSKQMALALVLLTGCTAELEARVAGLETAVATLTTERDALRSELTEQKSLVERLGAENDRLKETPEAFWQEAVEHEAAGRLREAEARLAALIERFPASPIVPEAKKRQRAVAKLHAHAVKYFDAAFEALERKVAGASDPAQGVDFIAAFQTEHKAPNEEAAAKVVAFAEAHRETAAEAIGMAETAAQLGLELSEFRTYWTVNPNVLGGNELVVPYLRFKITNVGSEPITSLQFTGSFELTKKKEILGEGTSYPVGYGDPPLKPGYSREVFFGSGTGYTGYGAYVNRPAVAADLYAEVNGGERTLVRRVRVKSVLR